jgi:hypothetical protein
MAWTTSPYLPEGATLPPPPYLPIFPSTHLDTVPINVDNDSMITFTISMPQNQVPWLVPLHLPSIPRCTFSICILTYQPFEAQWSLYAPLALIYCHVLEWVWTGFWIEFIDCLYTHNLWLHFTCHCHTRTSVLSLLQSPLPFPGNGF